MRTRIELGTSGDIELFEDISTPLNFTISDIREPEKRQGSYSKTISIPGSKQNNKLLGHIFDINIGDCTFNPKIKTPARIYINDIPQLTGYMQLMKIKKLDNYKVEYEVSIFGKNSNIFIDLGDSLLTDLDYTDLNHLYTRDEQVDSWTQDYTYGYVYPLIDYGFDTDINKYDTEHLFPATYLRTYIDKIFAAKGYSYQSTFFDSSFFKKLIIPCTASNLKLSSIQVDARIFNAYDNTLRTYTGNTTIGGGNGSPTHQAIIASESNDPSNQYNTSTYIWTVANTGYYNIYGSIDFYLSATSATTFPASSTTFNQIIKRKPNGSSFFNALNSNQQYFSFYPASSGDISSTYNSFCAVGNVLLNAGDQIKIEFYTYQYGAATYTYDIKIPAVVFENSVVNSGLISGNTIDYIQAIPQNIKQKDLLTSIIKMFNLYIDVDTDNDKKLIIETRDDFYSSGTVVDWSYKLDISRDLEYTPLGDLDFRRLKYSYKEDSDKYNKLYKDTYQSVFGSYEYDTGNEFLNNDKKIDVIFSATPIEDDVSSNRVVPRLWKQESNGTIKPSQFNIRLLYYGGLISNNVNWIHTERNGADISNSTYPFAGHVDNPSTPTLDLSFGVPNEIYYYTNYYTNNNLFNIYHKKFIDEITHKDSKVVVGYFHLTPLDILKLDFRNEFYFDNQKFRLNKIYDYNPIINEVTKCEFIKVKDAQPFQASTLNVNGAGTTSGTIVLTPFFGTDGLISVDGNNSRVDGNTGTGNTFGSGIKSYLGNGGNNYVNDYASNISLINSSGNIIGSGLENVTLINTNDTTVLSGDIALINGIAYPSIVPLFSPIKTITSNYNLFVFDGTLLCDCTSGNITINLTYTQEQYAKQWVQLVVNGVTITVYFTKIVNIKKIDSSANTVTLDPSGAATIDGSLTKTLTTQYESITIQWDGTNWHKI